MRFQPSNAWCPPKDHTWEIWDIYTMGNIGWKIYSLRIQILEAKVT